ncbi:ArsA-related P-loop ATPase [Smaragdicoccus niigatensis]|uniref:ArsA-related P-loop ATPase n=1 Tax=Smaragdicoccus niigatensis TaxID=359359 RepID=UPI00035FD043|nr:ArsA-related P-loop ATPase [Smaragdicoccus niigatensis]
MSVDLQSQARFDVDAESRRFPLQSNAWSATAARAQLHYVSGKGGTGKSTMAAALALALAAQGRRVLLVEVEGRQGIAPLFGFDSLPPTETLIETTERGGEVIALPIDVSHAFLEYLAVNYKLGIAGKALKRMGLVDFVTGLAPGLKDVIITGKIMECVEAVNKDKSRVYDAVVVDAPPTGRITTFLDVTTAMAELAKGGPIVQQADRVASLVHSEQTMVHLVTLLEALPVQETLDAIAELRAKDFHLGAVIVNRASERLLPERVASDAANGVVDAAVLESYLRKVGLDPSAAEGLRREVIEYAVRYQAQSECAAAIERAGVEPLTLPSLDGGVDRAAIEEIARKLAEQGVE